tara:strand:- start:484 stop:675 length:192 start_codon:yes stop_codon:yes gene_type:complete
LYSYVFIFLVSNFIQFVLVVPDTTIEASEVNFIHEIENHLKNKIFPGKDLYNKISLVVYSGNY